MLYCRLEGCLLFYLPPLERLSRRACSSASFWANTSYVSSIVSTPPWRTRVFLALRRLLSASFALRRVRTSANNKVILWANSFVPLVNVATVWKIGVGEFPWWRVIRFLINVVCKRVLVGLWGVYKIQRLISAKGVIVGIGIRNLILSFERIVCELKGTKLAPRNPAWLFWAVIEAE